jgi:hypothetical protein
MRQWLPMHLSDLMRQLLRLDQTDPSVPMRQWLQRLQWAPMHPSLQTDL